jgi:hypothetical protein
MQQIEMRPSAARNARAVLVVVALATLSGCAGAAGLTVAGAGAGVAMGTGVDYTLNGIAYKTFTAPMPEVRVATLRGLKRMAINVTKDEKTDTGWTIEATATDRTINIDLEKLTAETTRIRVVANDGYIFFKDRSTESEIIFQAAEALDHPPSPVKAAKTTKPLKAAKKEE